MSTEYFWGPLIGEETPLLEAAQYTDPFYAECRAYGRIDEALKKKQPIADIAVPCHGFFFLKQEDEEALYRRNIDLELDTVDLEYQQSSPGGCRARAIVKDLAPSHTGVNEKTLNKILRGIAIMNRQGIYNQDIRLDNFSGGRIVDFGSSWTEPHRILDSLDKSDKRAALGRRMADRAKFDEMVTDEKIPNPKKVFAMHPMERRSDRL